MITKSEEEYIMEEDRSKIADYLIKPVNPNQIELEKKLDHSRLISEKLRLITKEFRKIAMEMGMVNSYEDWVELYKN
jgi:hypothetical protein